MIKIPKEVRKILSEVEDREMVDGALGFLSLCKSIERKVRGFDDVFVEKRIKLNDRIYGKADFAATYADRKKAVVVDYKYGAGVPKQATKNPQLACYATCLRKTLGIDFESITVFIYQPRAWNGDGDTRYWTMKKQDLDLWEAKLILHSDEAYKILSGEESPEANMGYWCQFCPGSTRCRKSFDDLEESGLLKIF